MTRTTDTDSNTTLDTTPVFTLTRVFDAPRDLVWKVFTDPQHLAHWWGPKGFDIVTCTVDLRPGGIFHYCMRSPNGQEMWGKWAFVEIAEPDYLVNIVSFSDAEGNTVRAPFSQDWPLEVIGTTRFIDENGKTRITMDAHPHNATAAEHAAFAAGRDGFRIGCNSTWDQLETYLGTL